MNYEQFYQYLIDNSHNEQAEDLLRMFNDLEYRNKVMTKCKLNTDYQISPEVEFTEYEGSRGISQFVSRFTLSPPHKRTLWIEVKNKL